MIKQLITLLAASLVLTSCGGDNTTPETKTAPPDIHVMADDISTITIIYFDSGDNKSPSPNDSRWVVTNRTEITAINDIIQNSLTTLQDEPFGKSRSWDIVLFDYELSDGRHFGISMEKFFDDNPVFCATWNRNPKYFIITNKPALTQQLEEIGLPVSEFQYK